MLLLLRAENALDVAVSYTTCAQMLPIHVNLRMMQRQRQYSAVNGIRFRQNKHHI
jgi:hypothetical protein